MGALASAPALAARARSATASTADDIGVVSKHDTSTEMNDPAEADLHERLQDALGRTPGNPLLVVSQKTVTGHAKGGAAAWQLDGVLRMLETGVVPGNRNLESADPLERDNRHLALGDRPIRLAEPLRAALITSLGFGHVSAVLAIAHPDTFLAAVPPEQRDDYLARAGRRRAEGARRRLETRLGRPPLVRRPTAARPRPRTEATAARPSARAARSTGVRPLDVSYARGRRRPGRRARRSRSSSRTRASGFVGRDVHRRRAAGGARAMRAGWRRGSRPRRRS